MKALKEIKKLTIATIMSCSLLFAVSCSDSKEDMPTPDDIMGVWSPSGDNYLEFATNNEVHNLVITTQDGETIGEWREDVFFYEPGYQIVIYINHQQQASVYKIIKITESELVWCWVKDIRESLESGESIGQVIGEIIKEAQEGFDLDPAKYESMRRVSEDQFFKILESLDIMYPWGEDF